MAIQERNAEMVDLLRPDFQARDEPQYAWSRLISMYLALPGLIGFWPMSSVDENGYAYDLSGQGRTLQDFSAVAFSIGPSDPVMMPHAYFSGTDCLYRAMEPGLAPNANTPYHFSSWRGITMGAWVYFNGAIGSAEYIIANGSGSLANWSYILNRQADGNLRFLISNGVATFPVFAGGAGFLSDGQWFFVAGRYKYNTDMSGIVNAGINTVAAAAGALNTTLTANRFSIGASLTNAGTIAAQMNGRVSLAFFSNFYIPDQLLFSLYHQGKTVFG